MSRSNVAKFELLPKCLFFITKINVSFPVVPLIDTAVCGESSRWAPQWFKPNYCSFISSVGHLNILHGLKNLCVAGSQRQKPMLTQQKLNEGWVGTFFPNFRFGVESFMLGVAGLPNSIKASQRFPLCQLVWGGTASWNNNTFASGGLPRRLPSDSDHFLPSCWISSPVSRTRLPLWCRPAPTHLNSKPSSAAFVCSLPPSLQPSLPWSLNEPHEEESKMGEKNQWRLWISTGILPNACSTPIAQCHKQNPIEG